MNRLCVFAHWDRDNIIDDYVIYYLRALKELCNTIIFVSDCDLPECETNKLEGTADYFLANRHGEYDFGSYKRGFLLAEEKGLEYEELVFANDSCYGPFFPLKSIFEKMDKKNCDFWGLTKNTYGIIIEEGTGKSCIDPHVQSYFMVFKNNITKSPVFHNFIKSVKHEDSKNDIIINYEIGLSKLLFNNGFKWAVYINAYTHTENCLLIKWDKLIKRRHFPFLKTGIPRSGLWVEGEVKNWDKVILSTGTNYPIKLIKTNAKRLRNMQENLYAQMNPYRKIRYKLLKNSPMEMRWIVINIEKNVFKFLNILCFNKLKKF